MPAGGRFIRVPPLSPLRRQRAGAHAAAALALMDADLSHPCSRRSVRGLCLRAGASSEPIMAAEQQSSAATLQQASMRGGAMPAGGRFIRACHQP